MSSRRLLAVAVVVGVFVASVGFTAGATTYGLFSESDTGTGSIQAAASFDIPGDGACIDLDGDGKCNPSDHPIDKENISTFDNESADLIIPENVGDIYTKNDEVSITANSITSEVDLETKNGDISFDVGAGGIDMRDSNATIEGGGGSIDISSEGSVVLSGTRISTKTTRIHISTDDYLNIDYATIDGRESSQPINLSGRMVSAQHAEITNKNGETILSARNNGGGELDATDATIEPRAKNGQLSGGPIILESQGSMWLNGTSMRVKQTASVEAYLGTSSAILFADGTVVVDDDNTLAYWPDGVTRRP